MEKTKHFYSWMDTKISYCKTKKELDKNINELKEKRNTTIHDLVDLSFERTMRRELHETEKRLEEIILKEINTLNDDDIKNSGLTDMQLRVAKLRQKHAIHVVAELLEISKSSVTHTYKKAIKKIEKYKKLNKENKKTNRLSIQQKEIYKLMSSEMSSKEIAEKIGTTVGNVKKQKSVIRKKLNRGVTKNIQNQTAL